MDGGPSPTTSLSSIPKSNSRTRPTPFSSSSRPEPAKRIRVTQACDQCREVKRKCDVTVPICSPCVSQGQICTYTRSTKRRGTQPGYMRALETALAWVLEDVPGCQESLQRLLGTAAEKGGASGGGGDASAPTSGIGEIHNEQMMATLRGRWRESQLFEDMSAVLRSEEWMMGTATSQGSRNGGAGGGTTATVMMASSASGVGFGDENTPSTMYESEEESGGQWPIL